METLKRFKIPLAIGAGALVFAGIMYMVLISPQGKKVSSLHAQETQLQSQQTQLEAQLATLRRDKANMATNCAQLGKALVEIPGTPDVSDFLQQVTALAVSTGNPNTPTISVLQAQTKGSSSATPVQVSLTLQGTYGEMSSFIKGLDSFPRLFAVTNIAVTGGPIANSGGSVNPSAGGYNLTLTGAIFYSVGRKDSCQSPQTPPTPAVPSAG